METFEEKINKLTKLFQDRVKVLNVVDSATFEYNDTLEKLSSISDQYRQLDKEKQEAYNTYIPEVEKIMNELSSKMHYYECIGIGNTFYGDIGFRFLNRTYLLHKENRVLSFYDGQSISESASKILAKYFHDGLESFNPNILKLLKLREAIKRDPVLVKQTIVDLKTEKLMKEVKDSYCYKSGNLTYVENSLDSIKDELGGKEIEETLFNKIFRKRKLALQEQKKETEIKISHEKKDIKELFMLMRNEDVLKAEIVSKIDDDIETLMEVGKLFDKLESVKRRIEKMYKIIADTIGEQAKVLSDKNKESNNRRTEGHIKLLGIDEKIKKELKSILKNPAYVESLNNVDIKNYDKQTAEAILYVQNYRNEHVRDSIADLLD